MMDQALTDPAYPHPYRVEAVDLAGLHHTVIGERTLLDAVSFAARWLMLGDDDEVEMVVVHHPTDTVAVRITDAGSSVTYLNGFYPSMSEVA